MKTLFFGIIFFVHTVYAEVIHCEATRQDQIKVEISVDVYERGSISFTDPVLGRIGTQAIEKNLLRYKQGSELHFVSENQPHLKIFSFPEGINSEGMARGIYVPQQLEVVCSISGPQADELPAPKPITCDQSKDYKKSLFEAIHWGRVIDVEEALSCGASANEKNDLGCSALLYASDLNCGQSLAQKITGDENGKWISGAQKPGVPHPVSPALNSVIELLVNRGALINATDPKNGESVLIKLVRNSGQSEVLKSFIENEPIIDAKDNEGNTALMWATTLSTVSSEAYAAVLELNTGNANRNLKNKDGLTAYQIAKKLGMDEKNRGILYPYDKRILRQLLPASRTVVIVGKNGSCSPLDIVLKDGEAVEFRLESKDKMYLMRSPRLSLEIMAMGSESARQVITASQRGTFPFTCGIHGGSAVSQGKILVQ